MKIDKRRLFSLTVIAILLALIAARLDLFNFSSFNGQKRSSVAKLNQVLGIVNSYYVDTLDWQRVSTGAIEGLLQTLDPHSVYFNPVAVQQNEESFDGHYQGIGIQFDVLDDYITVISVISGSPSESAGLQAGDRIIAIDGHSAKGLTTAEVPKKLKGPKGSRVTVTIDRPGMEPFDVDIIRDEIPIFTINTYFKANDKTGYIWVNRFAGTTGDEFEQALEELEEQGIEQLILDLRSNGGGYLREAVNMVGKFINGHKKVVYTRGRLSRFDETYYSDDFGRFHKRDYPLIVLIDRSSASASEIVAGALQDYDRALIVGTRSFGKGLVQNEFELDDGSRIRLTVSKYYTPSGRLIQRPYKGKDIEEYYMESMRDTLEAEQDSLENRPQFHTAAGRTVYGGGGISPDVEVKYESYSKSQKLTSQLHSKRIFFETAADFTQHRSHWKNKPEAFIKSFTPSSSDLKTLRKFAEKKGIHFSREDWQRDRRYLENRLKAEIARNFWGQERFYRVLLQYDNQFDKALHLFPQINQMLGVSDKN